MPEGKTEVKTEVKREATSIKIDPSLWKEAKIEAIRRDIELSRLVEDALRKELGLDFESMPQADKIARKYAKKKSATS